MLFCLNPKSEKDFFKEMQKFNSEEWEQYLAILKSADNEEMTSKESFKQLKKLEQRAKERRRLSRSTIFQ